MRALVGSKNAPNIGGAMLVNKTLIDNEKRNCYYAHVMLESIKIWDLMCALILPLNKLPKWTESWGMS